MENYLFNTNFVSCDNIFQKKNFFKIPDEGITFLLFKSHLLNNNQKDKISKLIEGGGEVIIELTEEQHGGDLDTLLMDTSIPLLLKELNFI